ncbi:hypothetical protein HD554DRAFT_837957 [Boletus coccyginus]|nr:hypothetical protein HD554DRAFT_837957 [Boletus coccyginus]
MSSLVLPLGHPLSLWAMAGRRLYRDRSSTRIGIRSIRFDVENMRSLDERCIYNGHAIRSFPPRHAAPIADGDILCGPNLLIIGRPTGHSNDRLDCFLYGESPKGTVPPLVPFRPHALKTTPGRSGRPSNGPRLSQRTHVQVHRRSPSPDRT